jgi:hypothetical protein
VAAASTSAVLRPLLLAIGCSDSSSAAAGQPNGTARCSSSTPAAAAAASAASADCSCCSPLAACSGAWWLALGASAFGPCLLAARTTWAAGKSNRLLLALLPASGDVQGLHSTMLGPTLRGPSSHARCSRPGSCLLLPVASCTLAAYAARSL